MRRIIALALLALPLLLAACAEEKSATDAIEAYLKARIQGDADELVKLSCANYEAQAALEAASFQSVKAEFEGLECKEAGSDGDATLVTCSGTLHVEYRGEEPRSQPLGDETYRAVEEDGDWKMCGLQ